MGGQPGRHKCLTRDNEIPAPRGTVDAPGQQLNTGGSVCPRPFPSWPSLRADLSQEQPSPTRVSLPTLGPHRAERKRWAGLELSVPNGKRPSSYASQNSAPLTLFLPSVLIFILSFFSLEKPCCGHTHHFSRFIAHRHGSQLLPLHLIFHARLQTFY